MKKRRKIVEIVMISVSDLAPTLAVLVVIIFSIYSVSDWGIKEYN